MSLGYYQYQVKNSGVESALISNEDANKLSTRDIDILYLILQQIPIQQNILVVETASLSKTIQMVCHA